MSFTVHHFFSAFMSVLLFSVSNCDDIAEEIISSPNITNWGEWGVWENCSTGHYVVGYQLKVQEKQNKGDDTALNGISLLCGNPGTPNIVRSNISSSVGEFGDWGNEIHCVGLLTGFQLRAEPLQGDGDDTAANNMKGFCTSQTGETETYEGDGLYWGLWTEEQYCTPGNAVCAIQTQLHSVNGTKADDTALNNVRMKCCDTNANIWKASASSGNKISVSMIYFLCLFQVLCNIGNFL